MCCFSRTQYSFFSNNPPQHDSSLFDTRLNQTCNCQTIFVKRFLKHPLECEVLKYVNFCLRYVIYLLEKHSCNFLKSYLIFGLNQINIFSTSICYCLTIVSSNNDTLNIYPWKR